LTGLLMLKYLLQKPLQIKSIQYFIFTHVNTDEPTNRFCNLGLFYNQEENFLPKAKNNNSSFEQHSLFFIHHESRLKDKICILNKYQ
jgi:hypothetical protein